MATGYGVFDAADQIKILGIAVPLGKGGMAFQQEGVARLQDDVAQLALEPFLPPRHRQHSGFVALPETAFPDALAHQRAGRRHDGLDEAAVFPGGGELEDLLGGGHDAGHAVQIRDGLHNSHEDQTVIPFEDLVGGHGG